MVLRHMKVSSRMVRRMERESSHGVMNHIIKEILLMECFMVSVHNITKRIRRHIMDNSKMVSLKEMVKSNGKMVESIGDNLKTEKKMEKEHLNLLMEISTLESFQKERCVVLPSL